jgi:hypothetical protein
MFNGLLNFGPSHLRPKLRRESQMENVIDLLEPLRRFGVKLGPYVLLELLLPGGTLFALLLFLHRRSKANGGNLATCRRHPLCWSARFTTLDAEHFAS